MYSSSDLLVTFIIQYFMSPEIKPNSLNHTGAVLITCAMVLVMGFKLIDAKRQKQLDLDRNLGVPDASRRFTRFIFFKI